MTDLEMIKKCAEKEGYVPMQDVDGVYIEINDGHMVDYDPIHDDAQAMALVKKFRLVIGYSNGWSAQKRKEDGDATLICGSYHYPDLNRAIVECVSKLV